MLTPTLYQFFRRQVLHGFSRRGLAETDTIDYISDILTRFAQTEKLYAITDDSGHHIEHLIDFEAYRQQMLESNPGHYQRLRDGKLLRHIGEYTLFMTGLFREKLKSRGQLNYYISYGSSAFWHCADYEHYDAPRHKVFRGLYYNFAPISNVLDRLRKDKFSQKTMPGNIAPAQALWHL